MPDLFHTEISQTLTLETDFLNPKLKVRELGSQINWIVTHRKYDYTDQLFALSNHPSVSIRRKVAEAFGVLGSKEDLDNLRAWQLKESDRDAWIILEGVIDKVARGFDLEVEPLEKIYSISEALKLVKTLLGQKEYFLEGELSEVRPVRQMYYFGLKDKEDVRLDCACFAGVVARLGFPLNEGLTLRAKGRFRLSKSSRLYFDVQNLVLTGEGELARNLELLKQKLLAEGLLDSSRKRPIPKIPKKILLLASKTSAAFSDYHKVLTQRIGGIEIYFLNIKTQGVGAEYELLEKLQEANQIIQEYQISTVVLTRGGGSQDDLSLFNSEKIARAVHSLQAPVIVAIGHERDTTLAELVADMRASTPSQAAELSCLSRQEILGQVSGLTNWLQGYFENKKNEYLSVSQKLVLISYNIIEKEIRIVREGALGVMQVLRTLIHTLKLQTAQIWNQTLNLEYNQVFENKQKLNQVLEIQNLTVQHLHQQKLLLNNLWSTLQFYDPAEVLKKGYALIIQNKQVKEKVAEILDSEEFVIKMQDGQKLFLPKKIKVKN
jgi:exodeoxyribonuclease VII large subunit